MEEFSDEEDSFDLSNVPPYYAQKLNGFLRAACKQGHLTCVDVLVSKGADVNYIDKQDKTTVLHEAIFQGHTGITEYLFKKANEKTKQSARLYALDKLRGLEEALKVFKNQPVEHETGSDFNGQNQAKAQADPADLYSSTSGLKDSTSISQEDSYSSEKYSSLKNDYTELKKDYKALHVDYNGVQKDYDDLQKRYDMYKKETDELLKQLNSKVDRLNNELTLEKAQNKENEDVLESLGKELTQKMKEISTVKGERDTEKRAKEIAKKILSLDNMNMPVVRRNPLLDMQDKTKTTDSTTKNSVDLSNFDIQGKGNKPISTLIPNKVKKEGSKDDIEIHIEDRVKYRVRRLVRKWEEMTDL